MTTGTPPGPRQLRPALCEAISDYALFIERGYPVKGVLKLVGDRHRLSGVERNILYRGVASRTVALRRQARLIALPDDRQGGVLEGARVVMDGHNVLFTVVNYLQGRTTFISVDGYLRDAGNPARRIRAGEDFARAVGEVGARLRLLGAEHIAVYFDEPVTYSKDHIGHARRVWADLGERLELHLVRSADQALKEHHGDVLVTSDSTLIDATTVPVADMARWVIEGGFGARLPRLDDCVEGVG